MEAKPLMSGGSQSYQLPLADIENVALDEIPVVLPNSRWSRFKQYSPRMIGGICSIAGLTASVVAKVWNFIHWQNPIISTASSLGFSMSAQVLTLVSLPKGKRESLTDIEARWILEVFEGSTQVFFNLPEDAYTPPVMEGFATVFASFAGVSFVNDLHSIGSLKINEKGVFVDPSQKNISQYLIPMLEGSTANHRSLIGTQAVKTAIAVSLVTVGMLVPEANFVKGLGWIVVGHIGGTFLIHSMFVALKKFENRLPTEYDDDEISGSPRIPLQIKILRLAPEVLVSFKMMFSGIIFAIGKPWSVATLGFMEGVGKVYAQRKFEQMTIPIQEKIVFDKKYLRSAITAENIAKTTLVLGAESYIIYALIESPLPAQLALGSFMVSTVFSYILTKIIDRRFSLDQKKEVLNTLFFYFIAYPDYIRQIFLYIRQKQELNDEALDKDDPYSLSMAILAYFSFGFAWGNYRAIQSSNYRSIQPQITSPLAQSLSWLTVYKLFRGSF